MNSLTSKINNLYPSTKFFYVILVLISSIIVPDYRIIFGLVILNLFLAILARKFKNVFNPLIKFFVPLVLTILILQSLFYPGETVLFSLGFLSVKQEGIEFSLILISRILAIGTSLLLFFSITPTKDYVFALQKSGLSPKATYVVMSTLTIIPDLRKKADTIRDAQRSRGVETDGSMSIRLKSMLPIITPLIIGAITDTEEKVITLESRAFTSENKKTSLYTLEKTIADKVIATLFFIILITVIGGKII